MIVLHIPTHTITSRPLDVTISNPKWCVTSPTICYSTDNNPVNYQISQVFVIEKQTAKDCLFAVALPMQPGYTAAGAGNIVSMYPANHCHASNVNL